MRQCWAPVGVSRLGTAFRVFGRLGVPAAASTSTRPTHVGEARLSARHASACASFLDEDLKDLLILSSG